MKKYIAIIAAMLLVFPSVSAQGFLSRLKQKAQSAVEKKIEKSVDPSPSSAPQSQSATQSDISKTSDYAESDSDYAFELVRRAAEQREMFVLHYRFEPNPVSSYSFPNYASAMNGKLELPTAKEMISEASQEAYMKKVDDFDNGINIMTSRYASYAGRLTAMGQNVKPVKITKEQRERGTKVVEMLMALPEAERNKLEKLGDSPQSLAYIKANHPDIYAEIMKGAELGMQDTARQQVIPVDETRADAYYAVKDEMDNRSFARNSSLEDPLMAQFNNEFIQLRKDIIASWKSSEEHDAINRMEAELTARCQAWWNTQKASKFHDYPPFWSEERAKQNELVDRFNLRSAIRWRKKLAEWQEKFYADAAQVAAYDAKIQEIRAGGTEEDMPYLSTMMSLNALGDLVTRYLTIPGYVFSLPLVDHVNTVPVQ